METKPSEIVQAGSQHLRISPWRADPEAALFTPLVAFEPLSPFTIRVGISKARSLGYKTLFTSAVRDREAPVFLQNGFSLKEQLYILKHHLNEPHVDTDNILRLRKPSFIDLDEVVEIDKLCFDNFWTMNRDGLLEAESATTKARFRIATVKTKRWSDRIVGYAIHGIGDHKGYLQRLAVHPDYQGSGIAQQLVIDGIKWLKFWRARELYVNTQMSNKRALAFYLKMDFQLIDERLNILEVGLDNQNA